ncbi:MAG: sigma 54-interacting transcriptional regulator [Desulforhopalus sp.]
MKANSQSTLSQHSMIFNQDTVKKSLFKSPLFCDISEKEVEHIIAVGRYLEFERGQNICIQDANDRQFCFVIYGEVELSLYRDGNQIVVSHIGPGGHFGETSLLTGNSDNLKVSALTDVNIICFDEDAFNSALLVNDKIHRQLSIALAKRLQISFHDHAIALAKTKNFRNLTEHYLDPTFFVDSGSSVVAGNCSPVKSREAQLSESSLARQSRKAVKLFSNNLAPVLLSGETGTGRRMVAYEIHRASACKNGSYSEFDIRNIDPFQLETELFGSGVESFAFAQIDRRGVFNRLKGGTVVLYNAEYMEPDTQRQLSVIIRKTISGNINDHSRIILICKDLPRQKDGHNRLLPALYALVANQHFRLSPLREHRRDIPRLVQYYLERYSVQYGKTINKIDDHTLGMFINYDWPGNLTEMSSVLQRAVILCKNYEPINDKILLGVPKSEGKWEFNLLRLKAVRSFLSNSLFPVLPRAVVGFFFVLVLALLFFGPTTAEENLGLTLSWVVGWPLLIFSFFFLARTWCSICGLSVPGWIAQAVLKPGRPTPHLIRKYSGWIMTFLCIFLFWIETAFDAYHSPRLTGWIIFSITMSSLFFSMFFKRRVWCRYLCPLGAINALFAMPSIVELRSNTHMCMNRCIDHLCYIGSEKTAGCPMFRHPFQVDNNRDCILCGQCIKNCKLNSIHLNLRLAPQELWNLQLPRLEDSVLVVSLAAIFFPFAINQKFPSFIQTWAGTLNETGLPHNQALASSTIFFSCIIIYLSGYAIMSQFMARLTNNDWKTTASILGYGMIPLVLGAFMSAHLEIFIGGLWLLFANLRDILGIDGAITPIRIISPDATFVLQIITVTGGLLASLYASQRIVKRLLVDRQYSPKMFAPPAIFLCISAIAYLGFA